MKTIRIRYFKVQLKRAFQSVPYILLYLGITVFLIGILFQVCTRILATESLVGKIDIGIVLPEDDKTAQFAVSLVTSMDSVSSLCEFCYVTEEAGIEMLTEKSIFALVQIPDHFLEDIMSGVNTPVTIVSLNQRGVEAELFREFVQMGIDMLGFSQIGIYSVDEYCQNDVILKEAADKINWEINELYLKYTFSRTGLFEEKEISATGELSFVEYYVCAGLVMLSLFSGIPLAFYFAQHNNAFLKMCKTRGLCAPSRTLITYLAILFWSCIFTLITFGMVNRLSYMGKLPVACPATVLVAAILNGISTLAFVQLIYKLVQEKIWGILTLFFSVLIMMFLSGGFVPLVFLPDIFESIAKFLPTTYWIRLFGEGVQGGLDRYTVMMVLLCGIVCLVLSCILEKLQEYNDTSN